MRKFELLTCRAASQSNKGPFACSVLLASKACCVEKPPRSTEDESELKAARLLKTQKMELTRNLPTTSLAVLHGAKLHNRRRAAHASSSTSPGGYAWHHLDIDLPHSEPSMGLCVWSLAHCRSRSFCANHGSLVKIVVRFFTGTPAGDSIPQAHMSKVAEWTAACLEICCTERNFQLEAFHGCSYMKWR